MIEKGNPLQREWVNVLKPSMQMVMRADTERGNSLVAKSKNVTFDGKICYKLPSMLNHIFKGVRLISGKQTYSGIKMPELYVLRLSFKKQIEAV